MRFPGNVVTLGDTRSKGAGTPDKCFYCKGLTGKAHDADCVCIHRPVKIRLSIDMIVAMPRSWNKENMEFQWNESSSCKDNILDQLDRYQSLGRCLCGMAEVEYVEEASMEEAIEDGLIPDSETDVQHHDTSKPN